MSSKHAFNQRSRDRWVAQCAASVPAGSRVLDVGAGRGLYRPLFRHCRYSAHDFAQEPGTIGHYTHLDYVSDICHIPVTDESFDVVLCTEVLEHVPKPVLAIKELWRVLCPGGRLLLSAPLGSFLHQEPFHFYGGYTPHFYRTFLPETGFELDSIEANGGFFSFLAQEAQRFSALLDPRRVPRNARWPAAFGLWALTLPFCRFLLPSVAPWLDSMRLEHIATVGYHVVARKVTPHSTRPE